MAKDKTDVKKRRAKGKLIDKIVGLVVGVISLALIVSAVVMFSKHTSEVLERAQTEAKNNGLVSLRQVENKFSKYNQISVEVAANAEKEENMNIFLTSLITGTSYSAEGLSDAHYFSGKKIISSSGIDLSDKEANNLAFKYRNEFPMDQEARYLGLNNTSVSSSSTGTVLYHEFYVPVKNNAQADGIALYYSTEKVGNYIGSSIDHETSILSSLISKDGVILAGDKNIDVTNMYDELRNRFGDKTPVDQVRNIIDSGKNGTIVAKINGVDHIIAVEADSSVLNGLGVVELYEASTLAKSTTDFINAIVAIVVLFVIVILTIIGYLVYHHISLQIKVTHSESTDLKLQCLNRYGFAKESASILSRQNNLYYGVVVIQIRHFKFLNENFGEQEVNSLLTYLKTACLKTCKTEEVYGYAGNGEFLMFLHATDRGALTERLKIHSFLASQYKGGHKFDVALKYGIYEHQPDEKTIVSQMIDYAIEANNTVTKATVENVDMQFNYYSDELRKIRLINEDMELRQDSALKNGEFQVFYQAKYNLKTHKQDGAEALVRWYDANTGEYNKPALFMPLFESNGFIEKLDKYVYTKVCEYISYSLQQGRNVFPVSVNVSRITATQSDFVDYYTRIKKKYGIANGALTIEFTESFAYENYDVLKSIVDRLHKAGFKTSIDDFGCGYSSYRILKELPMDEIKLDKFFIDYSENPERINSIFESVIALAKKLDMKVTQEGVEKPEDVELLKKLGCDVIQGYVYSHPLSLTDYLHFVENTKDHNL